MKKLFQILLVLVVYNSFAQKVDWVNAPLNPVAFKYKLEDFNLKGKIVAFNHKLFREGKLLFDNTHTARSYYEYDDNGRLTKDSEERTYKYNNKDQIILILDSPFKKDLVNILNFEYDELGRLKSISNKTKKTEYTYNAEGRLESEVIGFYGVKKTITTFTYSKENNLLKIFKVYANFGGTIINKETLYYDQGVLVKQFDKNNYEYTWKTKTDTEGNYLQEFDVTFTNAELSENLNLTVNEDKRVPNVFKTYFTTVFINNKPALFIPIETINYTTIFFDIFKKDYYRIDESFVNGNKEFKMVLLAKNKEAIFMKPKQYNKLDSYYRKYNLVYAGLNRNPHGLYTPYSKVNIHVIGDTEFILYDRFFDTNYYASVATSNSIYILNEALPDMFYIKEKPDGQKLFYFIHNGVEIETPRLQLEHTNNEQDVNVFVDGKLTYGIKDYKTLEKEKVFYPTVF